MNFVPFFVDDRDRGFKRARSYPGIFEKTGGALVFNEDGVPHKFASSAVRVDVAAWRRQQQIDATVPDHVTKERMSIAVELRELWAAANQVPHKGNLRSVREALRFRVRAIAEIIDPEGAKKLWDDEPV